MVEPIWRPDKSRIENANITAFKNWLEAENKIIFKDYAAMHQFSLSRKEEFWRAVWEYSGIIAATRGERVLVNGD